MLPDPRQKRLEKVEILISWVEGERLGGDDLFFWRSTSGRRQIFTSKNKKSHHEGKIIVYCILRSKFAEGQCAFAVSEMRKVTANLSQTCGFAVTEHLLQFCGICSCGIEFKFTVPRSAHLTLCEPPLQHLYLHQMSIVPCLVPKHPHKTLDVPLNEAMRIISDWIRPTPLNFLPPLSGIQSSSCRRKKLCKRLYYKADRTDHLLHNILYSKTPSKRLKSRKPLRPFLESQQSYDAQQEPIPHKLQPPIQDRSNPKSLRHPSESLGPTKQIANWNRKIWWFNGEMGIW